MAVVAVGVSVAVLVSRLSRCWRWRGTGNNLHQFVGGDASAFKLDTDPTVIQCRIDDAGRAAKTPDRRVPTGIVEIVCPPPQMSVVRTQTSSELTCLSPDRQRRRGGIVVMNA